MTTQMQRRVQVEKNYQERIAELEAALEPFARAGDIFEVRAGNRPDDDKDPVHEWADHRVGERRLTVGDYRRARRVAARS